METFTYILMAFGAATLVTISYALVDMFVYWIKNQIRDRGAFMTYDGELEECFCPVCNFHARVDTRLGIVRIDEKE